MLGCKSLVTLMCKRVTSECMWLALNVSQVPFRDHRHPPKTDSNSNNGTSRSSRGKTTPTASRREEDFLKEAGSLSKANKQEQQQKKMFLYWQKNLARLRKKTPRAAQNMFMRNIPPRDYQHPNQTKPNSKPPNSSTTQMAASCTHPTYLPQVFETCVLQQLGEETGTPASINIFADRPWTQKLETVDWHNPAPLLKTDPLHPLK